MERDFEAMEAALEAGRERLYGRYGLALERDGFEFLLELRLLRMAPRVLVRRGARTAEVWLWEDDLALVRPSDFDAATDDRVLTLVADHFEELLDTWYHLREDMRRGRLGRNLLVY